MAIEAAAGAADALGTLRCERVASVDRSSGQCQDQPSESFPETSSESIGTEGVSESEDSWL